MQKTLEGAADIFVDDCLGVTRKGAVERDSELTRLFCTGLLGPDAWAVKKYELGRRLDWIGWSIDLDTQLVTIKRANFLKTLYGFLKVDMDRASVKELERLASWASRYSLILRSMRPFTPHLYAETAGMKGGRVLKSMKLEGRRAVVMWRGMLVLLRLDEATYARELSSFERREARVIMRFDSSLTGVSVSCWCGNSVIGVIGTRVNYGFDQKDSSYQNTMEFVAVALGFYILAIRGWHRVRVRLIGDSKTALKWANTELYKGALVFCPAFLYVVLGGRYDLWVGETQHISSEENHIHDDMSRGVSPLDRGFSARDIVEVGSDTAGGRVLALCDPSRKVDSMEELMIFWGSARACVAEVERTWLKPRQS
jgi:hypothetical protein